MPPRSRRQPPQPGKSRLTEESGGLRQRLQILAGFLLPLLVLSLWLNSRGFFGSP
ncbi:hypothetical protein KBZ12_09695 [Cyanobium sp. Cruz CV13-4-11]|jgi:hypothetical protein|uniref:hypothetical protein n=1 Tax=unclassified Cyanobium TaxID=2627006 RepID=UPI0020CDA1BC|nr:MULTISPECIES: hypothetical protein [unclassified Cyanobium]MCP9900744.1 hypothetical protein [Cyanobium sp. Cruz CV11-17]MCP9919751.1 hypothetical protein [Cyanobium sp. Cruz CV13-4-11]